MKKPYPSRKEDRWEHALTRPLTRSTKFELVELMRADLFEFLDVLTTCPYDDANCNKMRAQDIKRVCDRLTELTPRRAKALRAALKAGRVEQEENDYDHDAPSWLCGPYSQQIWNEVYKHWETEQ
jgi:hypothetical protein